MRTFNTCPILLLPEHNCYSCQGEKYLFDGKKTDPYLLFSFENNDTEKLVYNMQNISISGVQEKYSAVLRNHKIELAERGVQGTYILKPAPMEKLDNRKEIPANEHLTMQIAGQVYGINTACNGLCFDADDNIVYITKRYDVVEGKKLNQEDFASLIGKTETNGGSSFKYDGSYLDIAMEIKKRVSAPMVALEQFFKLVLFNYIYANGDAHLKNFSVLYGDAEVSLAPAYDLINTAMHIGGDDIGLSQGFAKDFPKSDTYDTTGHPCKDDFYKFGELIGLPAIRLQRVISMFSDFPDKVYTLIGNSFLSTDKCKRNYIRIIKERRRRFIR